MTNAQLTTSVSDGLLMFVSLTAAFQMLTSQHFIATIGFTLIGCAACLGTARFSQKNASTRLVEYHSYMSWLAHCLGLSCISVSFHLITGYCILSTALVTVGIRQMSSFERSIKIGEIVGSLAVVMILLRGIWTHNGFAIIGSMLIVIAGLIVGTSGQLFNSIYRVDIFHVLLTIANVALMKAIVSHDLPPLLYDR